MKTKKNRLEQLTETVLGGLVGRGRFVGIGFMSRKKNIADLAHEIKETFLKILFPKFPKKIKNFAFTVAIVSNVLKINILTRQL